MLHKSSPYEYKPHMYALQGIYKNNRKNLTFNTVIDYVNELPPARIMFSINYKKLEIECPVYNDGEINQNPPI